MILSKHIKLLEISVFGKAELCFSYLSFNSSYKNRANIYYILGFISIAFL